MGVSQVPTKVAQSIHSSEETFFTVYQTPDSIELHSGCYEYPHARFFCTSLSYESAVKIARLVSNRERVPLKNFVSLA